MPGDTSWKGGAAALRRALDTQQSPVPEDERTNRPAMSAGTATTWEAITAGTSLEGVAFEPMPSPAGRKRRP